MCVGGILKNPILVFLVSLEHIAPHKLNIWNITKLRELLNYPYPFEKWCVICGRKYSGMWWDRKKVFVNGVEKELEWDYE